METHSSTVCPSLITPWVGLISTSAILSAAAATELQGLVPLFLIRIILIPIIGYLLVKAFENGKSIAVHI